MLLFGGTFDPIHMGHLIVARAAAEMLALKKVILIPSAHPPHKENVKISAGEHRLEMASLAVGEEKIFEVSDCELLRAGPSYTLQTVRHFRNTCDPPTQLYWLIGADTIGELPSWYHIDELAEMCTIVTAARPGFDLAGLAALQNILNQKQIARLKEHILDTPQIDISATDIRRRAANGLSVRFLVPQPVADYISSYKLYQ